MENMGQMIEHKKQEKPPKAKQSRKPCSDLDCRFAILYSYSEVNEHKIIRT